MMDTTFDLLKRHPFLDGMPDDQLRRLSVWAHGAILHGGTRVLEEGSRADRFWLILDGQVRLETHLPGPGDVTVETLGPGSVLGWSWLFPPYRWHFSATAADLVHAIVVEGSGIRRLCDEDPAFGYELTRRFMQVVVDRLQQTRMRLLDVYAPPGWLTGGTP